MVWNICGDNPSQSSHSVNTISAIRLACSRAALKSISGLYKRKRGLIIRSTQLINATGPLKWKERTYDREYVFVKVSVPSVHETSVRNLPTHCPSVHETSRSISALPNNYLKNL